MLKYNETNWRNEVGLQLNDYLVSFDKVRAETTVEEQSLRAERLSLVRFFDRDEQNDLFEICARFQENDEHFYFNKNKKFHITLLGFPVIDSEKYGLVEEKIKEFSDEMRCKLNLTLELIRLGTTYEYGGSLKPVCGVSNGTIIGYGGTLPNRDFVSFGNELCSFLLKDRILCSLLGKNFRRKFPTVWCTMGHYSKDFKIAIELEKVFNEYKTLNSKYFRMSCHELELGRSCYKDLRDWVSIKKFPIR